MSKKKINERYFIMKMWQTGNIGSHNIAKIECQDESGYSTYKSAESAIKKLINVDAWDVINYNLTIIKIYSIKQPK